MTIMHVVARILLYGVVWFLTSTAFIMLFDWADKQAATGRRVQRTDNRSGRRSGLLSLGLFTGSPNNGQRKR